MIRLFSHPMFVAVSLLLTASLVGAAEPFVPGTGVRIEQVGDDFEDNRWNYVMNGRKASYEQDEQQRPPGGQSRNHRWYESAMRGHPDVIKRVPTPPGGIEGSQGAMLLATRLSGIPGRLAGTQMQDDLLMGVATRLGRSVPVTWSPSCTTRLYLPAFDKWENRTGASFGIRADVRGRKPDGNVDAYWPGFFVLFRSETDKRFDEDHAQISIRAKKSGRDLAGPKITEPGWWTFGMSFTPDGQVHYYASAGVDDLTENDYLYSSFPYGTRCLMFNNFFFNVANWENGKNWSTRWVVDDPQFFVRPPAGKTLAHLIRKGNRSMAHRGGSSRTAGKPANRSKHGGNR
ncbi:MAG: hypothetical protein MK171_12650 [Pirellulales bacterium]|nr:hypothetical protein [Pirellulales bacterium]